MRIRAYLVMLALTALLIDACKARTTYKYRIAVVPKGLTHEFWQSIRRGAERAAADLEAKGISVEILWDGPRKESDAQEQIALVQRLAAQGIQGLVLAPQHSEAMVPVVEGTVDGGIPVVIIDSGLDPDALKRRPDLIVKYVATDNRNGGRLAARRLLQVLGKEDPKLILFRYQVGSESTEQREAGFLEEIEKANKARQAAGQNPIEIVSKNAYSGATVETAEREAGPLLVRLGKKANGIFAVNESAATGMLNALRSQRLNKKIHLVAFDSSEPLLTAVEEGDVDGLIVQDPYRMGYLGVYTLVRHLEGDDVRIGGLNQSTGEHPVTRGNLNAPATRGLFDRQAQAARTIDVPEFPKRP